MEILYLMVLCSVTLATIFLALFLYSLKSGQFDEGESPAIRILYNNKKKEK